jgi:rare lipoprotein A
MKRALAVALAALIGGCATVSQEAPAPEPSAAAAPPPTGGRYYKDDGPGENAPPDLASIPDAEPRPEPLHRYANRPYQVFGRSYVPLAALGPYSERGYASWYGRRFHGQKTSSGEVYDMYAMTAAHPTLPIPSYARVTNVANGRSVVVRINDRGPFIAGRVIDLSYTAAYKLGFVDAGRALVEVQSVLPEGEALVYVQLGAFSARENAEGLRERLAGRISWLREAMQVLAIGELWRLHAGPYRSALEARSIAERIETELGLKPLLVVR